MYSSSMGKVCRKHIFSLLLKTVENMFNLDSEHQGMAGNAPPQNLLFLLFQIGGWWVFPTPKNISEKGHLIEENEQHIPNFFFKTNLFTERMKKFVALLTMEKWLKNEWENDN